MRPRIPLVATVIGALFIGGAVTGTTLALWRGQATLASSQVQAGSIGLTVNGSTSVTFTSLTNLALNSGATPGAAQSFSASLVNTGSGKNMRMQVHLDNVTADQADLTAGLEVAASTVNAGDACPTPSGTYQPLSSYTTQQLTTASLPPTGARKLCVDVRVKGSAPTAVGGKTGNLTFTFRGQQVQP